MFDYDPSEYVTIPKGWQCKRLIDCTEDGVISYGIVQPGQQDEEGIPVIRVNNVNNGQLDISDILKVSPEIEQKYNRTRLKGGEVLLTLVGSTGQSLVVPKEFSGWNVARAIAVIRVKEEVGADWVNICLQSKETIHFLDVRANTTVQKTLNLKDVRDIPILIPPKRVKDSIKDTALSLSSKIELNRQTNATLEHIAQAIFKSWFVNFEPTRAKVIIKQKGWDEETQSLAAQAILCGAITLADLNKLSDEQSTLQSVLNNLIHAKLTAQSIDKQIQNWLPEQLITLAELFPNKLVDCELRVIPKGWDISSLNNFGDIICGKTPSKKKPEFFGEDIPFIKIPDMHKGIFSTQYTEYLSLLGAQSQRKKQLPAGSICISCIATVGKVLITHTGSHTNQQINSIVPKYSFYREYIYFQMLHLNNVLNDMASGGSATLNLNTGSFSKLEILKPEDKVIESFSKRIFPLFQQNLNNCFEIDSLEKIRNTLLPKLLSGELSVSTEKLDELQNDRVSA